jgi:Leucine-rich repeat (LRR) protein
LDLDGNRLTSVPVTLGKLTALTTLLLGGKRLTSVPAACEKGGSLELNEQSDCEIFR